MRSGAFVDVVSVRRRALSRGALSRGQVLPPAHPGMVSLQVGHVTAPTGDRKDKSNASRSTVARQETLLMFPEGVSTSSREVNMSTASRSARVVPQQTKNNQQISMRDATRLAKSKSARKVPSNNIFPHLGASQS